MNIPLSLPQQFDLSFDSLQEAGLFPQVQTNLQTGSQIYALYSNSFQFTIGFDSSNRSFSNSISTLGSINFQQNLSINAKVPPNVFAFIFGQGATQDSTKITIQKTDLNGLTSKANNDAESLFVALLVNLLGQSQSGVTFLELGAYKWGSGVTNGVRIDTIIINLFTLLTTTNTYEISAYDSTVRVGDF